MVQNMVEQHERKLEKLSKHVVLPFKHEDVVTNLSNTRLSPDELDLLKNGLDFAIPPATINKTDIFTQFEKIHRLLTSDIKNEEYGKKAELRTEMSHLAINYYNSYKPRRADLKKHGILKRLRKNKDIVIVKPDKGNGVIILDRTIYDGKLYEIIQDTSKFKKLKGDETLARQGSLQRFLLSLKKVGFFTDAKTYDEIYPSGSLPSRLYGNPKMHKVGNSGEIPPLRPIVSSIGAYNYKLAKFLDNMLSPYVNLDYACTDTFTFVRQIQNAGINRDNFIVSYDVVSLFTNIPLQETLEIAVDTIFENKPELKICREQLLKLFTFATSGTHFSFNEQFYEQVDGVGMGSPLAPTLANLFLGYHEGKWIDEYGGNKPLYYKRYVDDVIAVFNDENEAKAFLEYLNTKHDNIKYTMEIEKDKKLAFLDVLLEHSGDLVTSIYRKITFTGLLTNYFSFTPMKYKSGLIKCLVDRIFKINNTRLRFHYDLTNIF